MTQFRLVWSRDESCQSPYARNNVAGDIRPETVVADYYEIEYSDNGSFVHMTFFRGDDRYMVLHWCPILIENMDLDGPNIPE